jgi:hypothetical protein
MICQGEQQSLANSEIQRPIEEFVERQSQGFSDEAEEGGRPRSA